MARRLRKRESGGVNDRAVYVISVAAELAGVHPQTLRIYERKGLLNPSRTAGNSRRYSQSDVDRLKKIQQLTQDEGVNLAGVRIIMDMQEELERMAGHINRVRSRMREIEEKLEDSRPNWGALVRLADVRNIFEERKLGR